jgi:hypothetical protein
MKRIINILQAVSIKWSIRNVVSGEDNFQVAELKSAKIAHGELLSFPFGGKTMQNQHEDVACRSLFMGRPGRLPARNIC